MCTIANKFDLVHQTVSRRERVGSGDETREGRGGEGRWPFVSGNACSGGGAEQFREWQLVAIRSAICI